MRRILSRLAPIQVALLGLACVILFQTFIVQGYGGNWTMLFCVGDQMPVPPDVEATIHRFPNSHGFDGQYYYFIARDFTDVRDTSKYVDNPPLRWLRALVPGMAAALAFGNPDRATVTYIGVVWLLCGLGLWLAATLCVQWGYPAITGFGFLMIPAVLVSLDRMMTDIALVVMLLTLVYAAASRNAGLTYLALAMLPLARETGLAITGGWVLFQCWKREWRAALFGLLSAIPFAAWFLWVNARYPGDASFWFGTPFAGIVRRLLTPMIYDMPHFGYQLAGMTDYLGAWGIAAAFTVAIGLFFRGERSMLVFAALTYTLGIALFTKEDMWGEAYSYSRTGGPVAVMLAVLGVEQRRWWLLAPMLLALPRVFLQYGIVSWAAIRGLL